MGVIAVPLAYGASRLLDVWAVFASISVAYVATGLVAQRVNARALEQVQRPAGVVEAAGEEG